MADLRRSLSMVLEQNAIPIELMERDYGVRVAVMPGVEVLRTAQFVLAVAADVPPDQLRARFPPQVKIGPVEKIRDLVNLNLPGRHAAGAAGRAATDSRITPDSTISSSTPRTSSGASSSSPADSRCTSPATFPGSQLEFWAIRG